MHARHIAHTAEEDLAVIEGLFPDPTLEEESVTPFVYIGDEVTAALAAASTVLEDYGITCINPFRKVGEPPHAHLFAGDIFLRRDVWLSMY